MGVFSFAFPWVLLALLLWFALPKRRGWALRLAASAFLVAALAQPAVTLPGGDVAVLVEVSDSVGEAGLEAASAFDLSLLDTSLSSSRTVLFAGESRVVDAADDTVGDDIVGDTVTVGDGLRAELGSDTTNLARALQLAQAQGASRILLLASGAESSGDALAALPDVPVDVYQLETVPNARLLSLLAPEEVSPGESVEVVAVVESDLETELVLRPSVDDRELPAIRRQVPAGRTSIRFSVPQGALLEGEVSVSAGIEVDFTQPTADDAQTTQVAVREADPVLVIGDPAMAQLLEAQGFEVVLGGPAEITTPFPYTAVVLREDAAAFSAGQLEFLEDFVRNGGGLMMTGSEASFGLSGWYRTPVEAVLPVDTALPTEVQVPQVAVVMVIDRSGSMRAERPSRISLARQGATELVELAQRDDLIGLVVFDDRADWVFRPRPATDQGKREMVAAIANIEPRGGTVAAPAYREALESLRETDAAIKHIIFLSDGEFFDGTGRQGAASVGPVPDFEALAAAGLRDGITTTTIGIGEANFRTLEGMAGAGGGRFYGVTETGALPRIVTGEAITSVRSVVRSERVAPELQTHPFTVNLTSPPPLEAYIASTLKNDAEMLLAGVDGEPILAVSRQELGRTAALTTDLNAWAGAFGSWAELPGVLGTVVRWLQVQPEPYSVNLVADENRLRVVVDAVQEGEYLDGERLEARYQGTRTRLEQTAPGRYEGLLETTAEGGDMRSVVISREGETIARRAAIPSTPVLGGGASELLFEIARRSGGEVLELPSRYDPPTSPRTVALWPALAFTGLLLFLLELLYRRFWRGRPE